MYFRNPDILILVSSLSLDQIAEIDQSDVEVFERCLVHKPGLEQQEISSEALLHLRLKERRSNLRREGKMVDELVRENLLDSNEYEITRTAREASYDLGATLETYERCARANAFTSAGLTLFEVGRLAGKVTGLLTQNQLAYIPSKLLVRVGNGLIEGSGVGEGTYFAYRRTRLHIKKNGTIDSAFARKLSETYCGRKGVELAAKETGIKV